MPEERLQKLIARAGMCSRRDAEDLIREGRVTVNGQVASLGDRADDTTDAIKVDGKRLKRPAQLRYVLVHKPVGVVTTVSDPEGRPTIVDLLGGRVGQRLFPVGRLDYASEGLVLLTNDGELAHRLAHPRYGVPREYLAKVKGLPDERDAQELAAGAVIEGHRVVPQAIELVRTTPTGLNSWWRVVVGEGKTHEVREMFRRIQHPVQRLLRVAIGDLRDAELRPGQWRELLPAEVDLLRRGGRSPGREQHGRTTSTGVHPPASSLRAGKARRGGATGARSGRGRQAGVKREPAGNVPKGSRGGPRRPS